jgi:hypothetical protein
LLLEVDLVVVAAETAKRVYARYGNACALCYRARDLQIHHKVHRSKASPGSEHRKWIDSDANLILLCNVCHGAQHGERVITEDGFCCDQCQVEWVCESSQARQQAPRFELTRMHTNKSAEEIAMRMVDATEEQ